MEKKMFSFRLEEQNRKILEQKKAEGSNLGKTINALIDMFGNPN